MIKCAVCFSEDVCLFDGTSFCKKHFNILWKTLTQKPGGKTFVQMREEANPIIS